MAAIFISEQEAREIIAALEYAWARAASEAESELSPTALLQSPEYREAHQREARYSRLMTDIKRQVMKITLSGHIPSKKNLLRRSKHGGLFRDSKVSAQIDALTLQARSQWIGREPLVRPQAIVTFHVVDYRSDLDNKWTTVLDCLRDAGVIKNDNISNGPRPVTYDWTESGAEGCVIELYAVIEQLGLRAQGMGA
jgi:Holliday junction resolvase RusA-like endonuclease